MAETRHCEQCGTAFAPRREHARFCSARCRVAWNREKITDRAAEASALDWSITAMGDTTGRLRRVSAVDPARALAVISEAVWWVTIVDATLVRYHARVYDAVLVGQLAAERRQIEGILGGLRFVRNQMGHHLDPADFIQPAAVRVGAADDRITAWAWKPVSRPTLASLPPRGQAWELDRYRAYQAHLAGHSIGETFGRAAAFLDLVAAGAGAAADASEHAAPGRR